MFGKVNFTLAAWSKQYPRLVLAHEVLDVPLLLQKVQVDGLQRLLVIEVKHERTRILR